MKKLNNIKEDREYLYTLLSTTNYFPKATFTLGCLTSDLNSLKMVEYVGEITKIDLENGNCNWNNEWGQRMPPININYITLHTIKPENKNLKIMVGFTCKPSVKEHLLLRAAKEGITLSGYVEKVITTFLEKDRLVSDSESTKKKLKPLYD